MRFIGKREQIVIGAIATLVTIALIHFFMFAPAIRAYQEAREQRDAKAQKIRGFKTLSPAQTDKLAHFQEQTQQFLGRLNQALEKLKLSTPEAFEIPDQADTDLEEAEYAQLVQLKKEKQIDLVMEELRRLREFKTGEQDTQMSFLQLDSSLQFDLQRRWGWNLPTELPQPLQSAQLWDMLTKVAEDKDILTRMSASLQRVQRLNMIYQSKLDYLYSGQPQPGYQQYYIEPLRQFGEFVPLFYRMSFADLILQRIDPQDPPTILEQPLDRARLFELLDIRIPEEPMPGTDRSKLYFAYEQLRNLNWLLEMAQQNGVKQVYQVALMGYGYLRQQEELGDPNLNARVDLIRLGSDETIVFPKRAESLVSGWGLQGQAGGDAAADRRDSEKYEEDEDDDDDEDDSQITGDVLSLTTAEPMSFPEVPSEPTDAAIGYAVLIKMSFIAENPNTWNYLYRVLKQKPLAELDRLTVRSSSRALVARQMFQNVQPDRIDLRVEPNFLMVSELFDIQQQLEQQLKGLPVEALQDSGPSADEQKESAMETAQEASEAAPAAEAVGGTGPTSPTLEPTTPSTRSESVATTPATPGASPNQPAP